MNLIDLNRVQTLFAQQLPSDLCLIRIRHVHHTSIEISLQFGLNQRVELGQGGRLKLELLNKLWILRANLIFENFINRCWGEGSEVNTALFAIKLIVKSSRIAILSGHEHKDCVQLLGQLLRRKSCCRS